MDSTPVTQRPPIIDGYVVERELGRGGTASVYEVRRERTGALFALKIGTGTGTRSAELLAREVEVLRGMAHRHLVVVEGTAQTSRGAGILMEYMPGGSVADLVAARGPVPLGEAITILAPVAQALAALHGAGAVHGDVAPGNILFTSEGMPKLGDLGLASLVGRPGTSGGTPGFSAPVDPGEGNKSIHPARDVFSIGAVGWYLLTGRTAASTPHRPPLGSLDPTVPDEFARLLEDCLQEDESLRPSAEEVARRVFCGTAPEPVGLTESVHPEAMGHMVTQMADRGKRVTRRSRLSRRAAPTQVWVRKASGGPRPSNGLGVRLGVAVAVTLLLLAGAATWWVGRPGPTEGTVSGEGPAPTASPAAGTGTPPAGDAAASGTVRASPSPGTTPGVPEDPARAAVALAAQRDAALSRADGAALRRIHHPDGTSLAADSETVSALEADGIRYDGLVTELTDVEPGSGAASGTVEVAATSTMSPYRVVDAEGRTVATETREKVQHVVLELRRSQGRWMIFRVVRDTGGA